MLSAKELTAEAARNEDKLRRSQQRELRLLQADDLQTLFDELTHGLQKSYGLQYVSVVLCDPDYDIRHLMLAAGAPTESIEGLVIVESMTGLAPQYVALRKPWLGPYAACDHQMTFPGSTNLRSVAMIPLRHRRDLIGSVNFGSNDATRFTREHASDFLEHLGVIASFSIENVVNRSRLLRSGFTDVLTGWHNRRYLQVRINEELARAQRDGSNVACLMLDVDHFKKVNDCWGHAAGDTVLREIAQRIESQVRASDVAARYGGEEFVVVLPDTDTASAGLLAERIRVAVSAQPVSLPGGDETTITISTGIAGISPMKNDSDLKTVGDSLIARADVALYKAKAGGRNRVVAGSDQ
jgi:diguanylate cyclase (GGDEF)-like protein